MNEVTHIKVESDDTKFLLPEPNESSLPNRFGIITAFSDPNGSKKQALSNWQADRALFSALIEAGHIPFRVVAINDNGAKASPAFGFGAPDTKAVQEIAKRFSQSVFYWVNNGKLQLKDTRSLAFEDLGAFHERVI